MGQTPNDTQNANTQERRLRPSEGTGQKRRKTLMFQRGNRSEEDADVRGELVQTRVRHGMGATVKVNER